MSSEGLFSNDGLRNYRYRVTPGHINPELFLRLEILERHQRQPVTGVVVDAFTTRAAGMSEQAVDINRVDTRNNVVITTQDIGWRAWMPYIQDWGVFPDKSSMVALLGAFRGYHSLHSVSTLHRVPTLSVSFGVHKDGSIDTMERPVFLSRFRPGGVYDEHEVIETQKSGGKLPRVFEYLSETGKRLSSKGTTSFSQAHQLISVAAGYVAGVFAEANRIPVLYQHKPTGSSRPTLSTSAGFHFDVHRFASDNLRDPHPYVRLLSPFRNVDAYVNNQNTAAVLRGAEMVYSLDELEAIAEYHNTGITPRDRPVRSQVRWEVNVIDAMNRVFYGKRREKDPQALSYLFIDAPQKALRRPAMLPLFNFLIKGVRDTGKPQDRTAPEDLDSATTYYALSILQSVRRIKLHDIEAWPGRSNRYEARVRFSLDGKQYVYTGKGFTEAGAKNWAATSALMKLFFQNR